jgi:predicted MFS family arabinose efflux permease
MIGLVISAISFFAFSFGWDIWVLVLCSFFAGLGGAALAPQSLGAVGDYIPLEIRGVIMAIVTAGMPIAYLVGVPLGLQCSDSFGWRTSVAGLGLFQICVLIIVAYVLPRLKKNQESHKTSYFSGFRESFKNKAFLPILIANVFLVVGYWSILTYIAAFMIQTYSIDTGQVAPLILLMSIGQLIGTASGGPLADRFDEAKVCAFAQLIMGTTGLAVMLQYSNISSTVVIGGLFMISYCVTRPAFFSIMVRLSSEFRGTVMGIQAISNNTGRALGAAIGGLLIAVEGYSAIGIFCLVMSGVACFGFFYVAKRFSKLY